MEEEGERRRRRRKKPEQGLKAEKAGFFGVFFCIFFPNHHIDLFFYSLFVQTDRVQTDRTVGQLTVFVSKNSSPRQLYLASSVRSSSLSASGSLLSSVKSRRIRRDITLSLKTGSVTSGSCSN